MNNNMYKLWEEIIRVSEPIPPDNNTITLVELKKILEEFKVLNKKEEQILK